MQDDGAITGLRNAEPCKLVGLEYFIDADSLENTYARVQLMLTDDTLPPALLGETFFVDLPPTHLGQADFVIHSLRFNNSLESNFQLGQRCKVEKLSFVRSMSLQMPAEFCSDLPLCTSGFRVYEGIWEPA